MSTLSRHRPARSWIEARSWRRSGNAAAPYLMVAPFALLFALFFVLPLIYAAWESLFRITRDGLGFAAPTRAFVGLEHYARALGDERFRAGLGRVLLYGAISVPVMLGLALVFALALDFTRLKLKSFFRTSIFIPYAVPGVVATLMWGFLYEPNLSPVAPLFAFLDLPVPDFLGSQLVLASIGNIAVWQWTGYNMIIIFAALQAIPPSVREAARIDGCGEIRQALFIKIPMIAPALFLTLLFAIIGTFQLFSEPQILASLTPAIPSNFTPTLYLYTVATSGGDYNYAAALSITLTLATFLLSAGIFRRVQRRAR